ncbi:Pkinase-domain-containing protein, partial [Ascoidea rubescens DSM 1968]
MYQKDFYGMSNINDYLNLSKLGEGTFGTVTKCKQKKTGKLVALKKLIVHKKDDGFPLTSLREITILKKLKHKNIIHENNNENSNNSIPGVFYMVTPYMSSDLTGLLQNPRITLNENVKKCFMIQLLEGLNYLHHQKLYHRDIKAANLLIDYNNVLKIADFGLARHYKGDLPRDNHASTTTCKYTSLVVTRWYRAPELLFFDSLYTTAIDCWGVGCVFGELYYKKPILQGASDMDQGIKIFELMGFSNDNKKLLDYYSKLPNPNKIILTTYQSNLNDFFKPFALSKNAIDLLSKLLDLNPKTRYNCEAALNHPYFKEYPLPSKPYDFKSFEESHEMDIKRYNEEK